MKNKTLMKDVTGKWVCNSYKWLWRNKKHGGCSSVCFEVDDKYHYYVCIGWVEGYDPTPKSPDGRRVGWKIGRQTHNNCMLCDMNLDFEMPYDPETGEVDDTEEAIETITRRKGHPIPTGYRSWNALAANMRKTARRVWNDWNEVSEE